MTLTIVESHRAAMDAAERADIARARGHESAAELYRTAFELEMRAATQAVQEDAPEPSRSVLLRSAASLALDCGEFRESERLISIALAGDPPHEIAEELRDLMQDVSYRRHLDLRGIALEPDELQVSIAGPEVGHGEARSEEVVTRIDNLNKLLHRTAERRLDLPYREGGSAPRRVREDVEVYVSVPRAASFAVSLRIGRPKEQISLLGEEGLSIVDELIECLVALEAGEEAQLRERIPDPAYLRNFVGLARQVMPDGQSVDTVGLTAVRHGAERRVALRTPRDRVPPVNPVPRQLDPGAESVTVTGDLRFADALPGHQEHQIKVLADDGKTHAIIVPEGMMADIVRPLWEQRVVVTGTRATKRGKIMLQDINPAPPAE
jgi:hypothetical protein